MKKRSLYHIFTVTTLCLLLVLSSGCAKDEEQLVEEKGAIDKMTDEAAETAVKKIRTPMDKARATGNLGDERMEEMDKVLQKQ